MKLRMLIILFAAILTLVAPASTGQSARIVLPADLQGELEGVPYRIVVPQHWNGTLLVYAHGYGEGLTPPRLAPQPTDVDPLLGRGFALAASRFAGSGWNVKEGMQNTVSFRQACV